MASVKSLIFLKTHCHAKMAPDTDLYGAPGISGEGDRFFADAMEFDEADEE
jgi:hypothetical protein